MRRGGTEIGAVFWNHGGAGVSRPPPPELICLCFVPWVAPSRPSVSLIPTRLSHSGSGPFVIAPVLGLVCRSTWASSSPSEAKRFRVCVESESTLSLSRKRRMDNLRPMEERALLFLERDDSGNLPLHLRSPEFSIGWTQIQQIG